MDIQIRNYELSDARALTDIFYNAVHAVGREHYSPQQLHAWAPLPKDYTLWEDRLRKKSPFVAVVENKAVGFITLEEDGHIDWTYVHTDYQGMGVGAALYEYLEREARYKGINHLYVEASNVARPFFERRGFSLVCRNEIERNGQILENWSMDKFIDTVHFKSVPFK